MKNRKMKNEEIFEFGTELMEIWRDYCSNWQFGEFMYVVFNDIPNAYKLKNKELLKQIRKRFTETEEQTKKRRIKLLRRNRTI